MSVQRVLLPLLLGVLLGLMGEERAHSADAGGFIDAPGKDLLMNKCFQCHGEKMWKDLKHDRRSWEGVLYRMVGRGALWTEEEINNMAGYLATAFGPQSGKNAK